METTPVHTGPKDFFMYLLGFGTMYASAVSFIALWFQYINIKFPDPLNQYYSYGYEQLRLPMAALIVLVPVFLFLSRWMNRAIAQDPARKELRIYKWLVYLTLFVSAVTVIIDLITLINNFLGGELTARFGLKILVVLVVALGVFGYYLWHLRSDLGTAKAKRKGLFWGAIIATAGSIIIGFFIVGSPSTARAQRFDQQRVNDLQNIQQQVIDYWQPRKKLPTTLENNDATSSYLFRIPNDPETGLPYEYRVTGALSFELCAVFDDYTMSQKSEVIRSKTPYGYDILDIWDHDKGRTCFSRTIDPELYKAPQFPILR